MSDIKIKIDSLYKIFVKNPKEALEHVKQVVGKDELTFAFQRSSHRRLLNYDQYKNLHLRSLKIKRP